MCNVHFVPLYFPTCTCIYSHCILQQYSSKTLPPPPIHPHPALTDVIVIPSLGPRTDLIQQKKRVVVGLQCGLAVLRGADVFAPGVMGAPRGMKCRACDSERCMGWLACVFYFTVVHWHPFHLDLTPGDHVSVLADVDGKCKRGLVEEYKGRTLFVGNGYAKLSRRDLFGAHATLRLKSPHSVLKRNGTRKGGLLISQI